MGKHFVCVDQDEHFNCTVYDSAVVMIGKPGDYLSAVMVERADGRPGQEYAMIQDFSEYRKALEWASTVAGELWNGDAPNMTVREYRDMMTGKCALSYSLPMSPVAR